MLPSLLLVVCLGVMESEGFGQETFVPGAQDPTAAVGAETVTEVEAATRELKESLKAYQRGIRVDMKRLDSGLGLSKSPDKGLPHALRRMAFVSRAHAASSAALKERLQVLLAARGQLEKALKQLQLYWRDSASFDDLRNRYTKAQSKQIPRVIANARGILHRAHEAQPILLPEKEWVRIGKNNDHEIFLLQVGRAEFLQVMDREAPWDFEDWLSTRAAKSLKVAVLPSGHHIVVDPL